MLVCLHARLVKGIHTVHTAGKNAGEHIEVEEFAEGILTAGAKFKLNTGDVDTVCMQGCVESSRVELGEILFVKIIKAVIKAVRLKTDARILLLQHKEAFKSGGTTIL